MQRLGLQLDQIEQLFRRMVFNIVTRNQDDHTKNIAFLMDRTGQWTLSPAFDLTFACNPQGDWTSRHQMSLNGKQSDFTLEDFRSCARLASLKRGRAESILADVVAVVERWAQYAGQAGVSQRWCNHIDELLRLQMR